MGALEEEQGQTRERERESPSGTPFASALLYSGTWQGHIQGKQAAAEEGHKDTGAHDRPQDSVAAVGDGGLRAPEADLQQRGGRCDPRTKRERVVATCASSNMQQPGCCCWAPLHAGPFHASEVELTNIASPGYGGCRIRPEQPQRRHRRLRRANCHSEHATRVFRNFRRLRDPGPGLGVHSGSSRRLALGLCWANGQQSRKGATHERTRCRAKHTQLRWLASVPADLRRVSRGTPKCVHGTATREHHCSTHPPRDHTGGAHDRTAAAGGPKWSQAIETPSSVSAYDR